MGRSNKQNYAQRARNREQRGDRRREGAAGADKGRSASPYGSGKPGGDGNNPAWDKYRDAQIARLPQRLPRDRNKKLINVFVEGYEDVSFWRGIFDEYESPRLTFEINVPPREDLAKGKKVIMAMVGESSPGKLLCVDSDFDYLFGDDTEQSRIINNSVYMFHTYAYSTENYLCYAPSLHNVCVKATKNDARIFDFERFMAAYSRTIYPLFVWYAYSARLKTENVFTLLEFKGSVKINYLEVENSGAGTIEWLRRQVDKRLGILRRNNPHIVDEIGEFGKRMLGRGLKPEETYMYMQGHTLMDNVVIVMLNAVCDQLKLMSNIRITTSTKTGTALKNEMSNYNNALRNVRDVLLDNESYKECPQYKMLRSDIESFIATLK